MNELQQLSSVDPSVYKRSDENEDKDDKLTLIQRAANSLIWDHLKHSEYHYTLSVFVPECGLATNKVMCVFFCTASCSQLMTTISIFLFLSTIELHVCNVNI